MKIICFGDSNTYGYDPRSFFGSRFPEEERWVNMLGEKLSCMTVNAGENGREIPHRNWELAEFERMLTAEKSVDFLLVMLGTNDLLQGNSVTAVEKRMRVFLQKIDLYPTQIILIAPPTLHPGEWVASGELVKASLCLNDAFMRLADDLGVQFVNTSDWSLPISFDGVHLTQEGHRAFADHLIHFLKKENELC